MKGTLTSEGPTSGPRTTADGPTSATHLERTALHERHAALGARFTGFAGWEMPLRYGSIIDEHRTVRGAAGLFDLSHMGEVRVHGPDAATALGHALVSEPARLAPGRAQYSLICTPGGGIIDDLIVYRLADDELLVVPNAANREAVVAELTARLAGSASDLADETRSTSLLALQGPAAADILAPQTRLDLASLRPWSWARGDVAGTSALVARTGYTGEDGFELFVAMDDGPGLWDALLAAGAPHGLAPCGLGARDTLRLEAAMPLYGNELDREIDPFEAGLGRFVHLERTGPQQGFVGRDALLFAAARPPRRQLVGVIVRDRGIARHGYPVHRPRDGRPIGVVTSGSLSPTLGEAIALAYVPPAEAAPGTMLEVMVRESAVPAEVVPLPFYKRPR